MRRLPRRLLSHERAFLQTYEFIYVSFGEGRVSGVETGRLLLQASSHHKI